tara:strand:+ start:17767 stop:18450 length:684 start_codon:yes stop_codon:yes gene_type:complete
MQLEILNLSKRYAQNRGLLPTSFNIAKGELVAIVGHNGAGKSTLIKMLANCIVPDSGHVMINGINLRRRTEVVKNIAYVSELPCLFNFFSVNYNLRLFAQLYQLPSQRILEVLEEFKLLAFRKTKVDVLSKGLQQRVSIARALLTDPPLLLFDEPTSGLDFEMTNEIYRLLKAMHGSGKTILFTTHRPEEIKNLATRIMVLHEGSVVFDGPPQVYFKSATHDLLYAG